MLARGKVALAFLVGLALGVAALWDRPRASAEPMAGSFGAVPPHRVSLLVLKHLLDTRPDARTLKFAAWYPPVEMLDNPLTNEPATEVAFVLRSGGASEDAPLEGYCAYVRGDRVLGIVPTDMPMLQASTRSIPRALIAD
jgi:hypothetical protein